MNKYELIDLSMDQYYLDTYQITFEDLNIMKNRERQIDNNILDNLFDYIVNDKKEEFQISISKNRHLINSIHSIGTYLLHFSAYRGKNDFVTYLLFNGADANLIDRMGKTAQHYAVLSESIDIIDSMIMFGVDMNVRDTDGNPPLNYAILKKNSRIILRLQKYSVNPFITNNDDLLSIDYCYDDKNMLEIISDYMMRYIG